MSSSVWEHRTRASADARAIADRHYNRQKVGATQFVPPGRCLVLLAATGDALWITSYPFAQYVKHRWAGAWTCSAFRNEGPAQSSILIAAAIEETRRVFGDPPAIECWMVERRTVHVTYVRRTTIAALTFVDETKVKTKRDPGRCFRRAGWIDLGRSKGGLLALGLQTASVGTGE